MSDAPFPDGMLDEIRAFFHNTHPRLSPGQDSYPEIFNTGLFFPLQRRLELESMMRIARSINPKVVFDIGSDKGGGLYHWCMCLPTVRQVIACEIRGLPYAWLFEKVFPHIEFLWIPQSSRNISSVVSVANFLRSRNSEIDVLFLDGEKTAFEDDFNVYYRYLSPQGLVFLHDVMDDDYSPNPNDAYTSIIERYGLKGEIIYNIRESIEEGRRETSGIPPQNPYDGWLRYWNGRSCGVGVIRLGKNSYRVGER